MSLAAEGHQVEIVAAKACEHHAAGEPAEALPHSGGQPRRRLVGARAEPEA